MFGGTEENHEPPRSQDSRSPSRDLNPDLPNAKDRWVTVTQP
jgi:hypothetical protein